MKRRTSPASRASGFSLVEVVVVVAALVLLAAFITPQIFSYIDDSKAARAAADSAAVGAAMTRFFQDTKRWPGQVEILESSTVRFLTVGEPTPTRFPVLSGTIGIGTATCGEGLSGVEANVTTFVSAMPSAANTINVATFLMTPPPASDYPNWKGPYLSANITGDPWEMVYVVNVIPLFCGEAVTQAAPGGALGFGWIISGGPNGTIQTPFTSSTPTDGADDVGVTLSKRIVQGTS